MAADDIYSRFRIVNAVSFILGLDMFHKKHDRRRWLEKSMSWVNALATNIIFVCLNLDDIVLWHSYRVPFLILMLSFCDSLIFFAIYIVSRKYSNCTSRILYSLATLDTRYELTPEVGKKWKFLCGFHTAFILLSSGFCFARILLFREKYYNIKINFYRTVESLAHNIFLFKFTFLLNEVYIRLDYCVGIFEELLLPGVYFDEISLKMLTGYVQKIKRIFKAIRDYSTLGIFVLMTDMFSKILMLSFLLTRIFNKSDNEQWIYNNLCFFPIFPYTVMRIWMVIDATYSAQKKVNYMYLEKK